MSTDQRADRLIPLAEETGRRPLRVEFADETTPRSAHALLALLRFGAAPSASGDEAGLVIDVGLERLDSRAESSSRLRWYARGPVRTGELGDVRYAHDDAMLFATLELDERDAGGIEAASALGYAKLRAFQRQTPFAHLLRVWNYFDAINEGDGVDERYQRFCVGRARGLGAAPPPVCPAATAIGRRKSTRTLQVFWIAERAAPTAIENPRQVSAWRYPRQYSPVSPGFSRATRSAEGALFISGTASIVGHESMHRGDVREQLDETLRNLSALTAHADRGRDATFAGRTLLKVYVREPDSFEAIRARLSAAYPAWQTLYLVGDVCRRELLVEIEALRLAI